MPQKLVCPSQSIGLSGGRMPSRIKRRLSEPNRASSCDSPLAPTKGGMIIGTRSKLLSRVLPRNWNRVVQCASGSVSSVVSAVVKSAMAKLLKRDSLWRGLSSSNKKYFRLSLPSAKNAPFNMKLTGYRKNAAKKSSRNPRKAQVEKFRSYLFATRAVSAKPLETEAPIQSENQFQPCQATIR